MRLRVVWDPLLTRWYGWEWDGFGLACVEPCDLWTPFGSYFGINKTYLGSLILQL
jgi:hypothetical protein